MDQQFCTCCERPLKPGTEVWLELSTRTGLYAKEQPPEESQGGFPFGKRCAEKQLGIPSGKD